METIEVRKAAAFTMGDVYAVPEKPVPDPVTEVFKGPDGKDWAISFDVRAKVDAEKYFELSTLINTYALEGPVKPLRVTPAPGGGPEFEITYKPYLLTLFLLEATVLSPKLMAEDWAIVGKRFGADFINVVSGYAIFANGLTPEESKKDVPDPKSSKRSRELSSTPASGNSGGRRRKGPYSA